jgi:hypothetical protein
MIAEQPDWLDYYPGGVPLGVIFEANWLTFGQSRVSLQLLSIH